jgi:hypothetical protein
MFRNNICKNTIVTNFYISFPMGCIELKESLTGHTIQGAKFLDKGGFE